MIVDAPRDNRIYNSFDFRVITIQSMPINKSGLLEKFFIAAKFDHTIPSGWPLIQIGRRIHINDSSYFSQVLSTTMEPRPTGYLNVFEYDLQNMAFDVQNDDLIQVFWLIDTNVSRRYSLAYFGDSSNVMLLIEINQTIFTTLHDSISTDDITTIAAADTPMITGEADVHIVTTIISAQIEHSGNKTAIIIGCLITIILALMLFSTVTIIIVLTYRHHKSKTAPYATQQTSKDFDMDSNQASTTQEEAKQDEIVGCIEMDANQAYITHSETKGEQGDGKKEMGANQGYATDTVPTDPNVAYGTANCIDVDANPAYGTNTVPTDPNVAYGTADCIGVDANPAYGTNIVPNNPNVAHGTNTNTNTVPIDPTVVCSTHPPDYDYVALP